MVAFFLLQELKYSIAGLRQWARSRRIRQLSTSRLFGRQRRRACDKIRMRHTTGVIEILTCPKQEPSVLEYISAWLSSSQGKEFLPPRSKTVPYRMILQLQLHIIIIWYAHTNETSQGVFYHRPSGRRVDSRVQKLYTLKFVSWDLPNRTG